MTAMKLHRYPSLSGGVALGKIGARRTARILPYDAEVEYLEGIGSESWIDTGVTSGFVYASWDFELVAPGNGYNGVWGASFGDNFFGMYFNPNSTTPTLRDIRNGRVGQNNIYGKKRENQQVVYGSESFTLKETLKLFRSSGVGNRLKLRFKTFSLGSTSGAKDILDLFAVRFKNENGQREGAMYDNVSCSLLRNPGTTAFVIGSDK